MSPLENGAFHRWKVKGQNSETFCLTLPPLQAASIRHATTAILKRHGLVLRLRHLDLAVASPLSIIFLFHTNIEQLFMCSNVV